MANLDKDTVKRVRQALVNAGVGDKVIELAQTVRGAVDAAQALGVEQGAIVKSLVFTVGNRYVLALMAGDRHCSEAQLPRIFNLQGQVVRPPADLVRAVTGFDPGGVCGGIAPVGLIAKLPITIDASLKRFDKVYVAAGHSHCVFETTPVELKTLTGGLVSYAVAQAIGGAAGSAVG